MRNYQVQGGNQVKHIVLVSHGEMAQGVKATLEMLIGKQDTVHAVSLRADGDNIQFEEDLTEKMKALYEEEIIIIADLLGGTPCNVAVKNYLTNENIMIVAGMSLPLVIEAAMNPSATIKELVKVGSDGAVDVKVQLKQAADTMAQATVEDNIIECYPNAEDAIIVNTRIDERLIHGQVAGIWSTSLDTQRIIVANDAAAADPLQKSSLRMATPTSMRLSVLPVIKAAQNIQSGKYGKQRIFLLFKNPTDVLTFIEAGGKLTTVNVGNMSHKTGTREVTKSIKVLPEEEIVFEKIATTGVSLTAQLVPNDPSIDFLSKLRN